MQVTNKAMKQWFKAENRVPVMGGKIHIASSRVEGRKAYLVAKHTADRGYRHTLERLKVETVRKFISSLTRMVAV